MPTYTPSFNNPITKNLKVTDSLILSPSATGPFSISSVTDSFTAQSNSSYNWTTTVSSETVTLPLTPVNGAYVIINDNDWTWGNFPPVVNYNGANTKGAVANASDLSAQVGGEIKFIYNSSLNEWTSYLKPVSTDDPFHGWWKNVAKTNLGSSATTNQYFFIDPLPSGYTLTESTIQHCKNVTYYYLDTVTNYPDIKLSAYAGNYDEIFGALLFEYLYQRLSDGVSLSAKGVYGTPDFNWENFAYYYPDVFPAFLPQTVTLQSTNNQIFGMIGTLTDPNFIWGMKAPTESSQYSCLLEKMSSAPIIRPYSNDEVSFSDLQDPINMFNFYVNQMNQKGYGNYNTPYEGETSQWYPGYYNQQKIVQDYLNGKTSQYSIIRVKKSTVDQYQQTTVNTRAGTMTGATIFYLGDEERHLVTKGSSITISGFTDEWSSINGVYPNSVIADNHYYPSSGHFDANSSNSGTFYNQANYFVLRLDTSSLTGVSTGPYKGEAIFTGNPTISVTHHITSDINYNNFIGAMKAYTIDLYGGLNKEVDFIGNNLKNGKVVENWDDNGTFGWSFSSIEQSLQFFHNMPQYSRWGGNLNTYAEHYNVLQNLITYLTGSTESGWSIPALNYLDPNETYNIYYALDGDYSTGAVGSYEYDIGRYQEDAGFYYNMINLSNSNLYGGDHFVYTGAKWYGWTGPEDIDRTVWNILGSVNTFDTSTAFYREKTYYNANIYGLIRSDITSGKKIGYIKLSDLAAQNELILYSYRSFLNVYADKNVLANAPDKTLNGIFSSMMPFIMKYFNSQEVDGIIVDERGLGTYFTRYGLGQWFGGDRLKLSDDYFYLNTKNQLSSLNNTSDYEYYLNLNNTGSDNYLHPNFLESSQGYGTGSVYHGSSSTGGRVVVLEPSLPAVQDFIYDMLGDNNDRQIGNNTRVKILGHSYGINNILSIASIAAIPPPYIQESIRGQGTETAGPGLYASTTPSFKLSTGSSGAISLNPANKINDLTAVDAMTSITGAFPNALGNPFPCDMATIIYPAFGFVENSQPRLPGDSRPQQPDPTVSGTWRDSWLEASIAEITLGTW